MIMPPFMSPSAFDAEWRKAQKEKEPPKTPDGAFHFDPQCLQNVLGALAAGDISDCKTGDIKHTIEAMKRIFVLADLAPDFLDGFVEIATEHFVKAHYKAALGEWAQKNADKNGYGEEWRAAIEAGKTPNQKDYMLKVVEMMMKASGQNQNQVIKEIAKQYVARNNTDESTGTDIAANIRRTVTRSKKRKGM